MTLATSTALLWPTTTKNRPHRPKKYKNSQQVVIRQMSWLDEYTENIYFFWNISSGSFLRKIIFFHLPNGSQKCILKWSYCPEMLAPFLTLIFKTTSFSISYHLDQPLPSSRPPHNVENRVYLLIFTPRPLVKFLWSKMGCLDLPHIVLHILCSTRTCWGHFRHLKVSFNAFLAVLGQ